MSFRNRTLWICGIAIVFIQCNGETESSSSALDAITKNRRVRISADAVNPPFVFGQATGVQGFDVDTGNEIVKDIAKELGRELDPKWVKAPFETLFKQLQDGNTEMVISCMAITPEREKTFDFSQPYFESALTIARRRDVEDIKTLADLAGKRVGVQASATSQYFLETQPDAANMSILKFKTLDDALGALNRTEIDAVVGDEPILSYSIDTSFPNLITTGEQLVSESYGVMVRKGEEKLLQLVNATLDRLKSSGEFDTWQEKWKIQSTIDKFQQQRAKKEQEKALREGPKAVTLRIVKTGGSFRMDRLDGYQIQLVGKGGSYKSNHIVTDGSRSGTARFRRAVPPGVYRLSMPIFGVKNQPIEIPEKASKSVRLNMRVGRTIDIDVN